MKQYSMYEIIHKKKNGKKLDKEEFKWVIDSLMNNSIADYQMSALLMAMFIKGLNAQETAYLTDSMLYSGKVLQFDDPTIIDKHSTGGIGDKASFILAPIASACGVKVPMIAGRSLGFTGGTIDKVESIPGFQTKLNLKEFKRLLIKNSCVLIGQTDEIAPADKKIYALRDVTATIDSIALITASIMSKKLAEGANGIVMDIKLGSGAFMKKPKEAEMLALSIIQTAKRFNKKAVALITDMNQPLGNFVGNSLEIKESVETLKNKGPEDLTELSLCLAAHMINLAGIEKNYKKSYTKAKQALESGKAYKEFEKLIKAQGGDLSYIRDLSKLNIAPKITKVYAKKDGIIKSFQNDEIGYELIKLGGGRKTKKDKLDLGVGFEFHKKINDKVSKGEPILSIYHRKKHDKEVMMMAERFNSKIIKLGKTQGIKNPIIIKVVS